MDGLKDQSDEKDLENKIPTSPLEVNAKLFEPLRIDSQKKRLPFYARRRFWRAQMAWHYLVWRDRLLSLSRPEGSILQQAGASPWYIPRGISQSERLPQDVCIHTLFMQAPYGSLSDCEIPSWNIPGRCPIGLNLTGLLSLYLNDLGLHNRISARSALECGRLRPLFVPWDGNAKRHCMDSSKAACTNYFTLREL